MVDQTGRERPGEEEMKLYRGIFADIPEYPAAWQCWTDDESAARLYAKPLDSETGASWLFSLDVDDTDISNLSIEDVMEMADVEMDVEEEEMQQCISDFKATCDVIAMDTWDHVVDIDNDEVEFEHRTFRVSAHLAQSANVERISGGETS